MRIHDLKALVEIGRRDAGGASGDLVERGQTTTGQRVAGDDRGQQRQRNGQQQRIPNGSQQQSIVFERVQYGDQQRRLARILRRGCQPRDTGTPVDTAHAYRTHGDLALIGDLHRASLHDVTQQRAYFIGQQYRLVHRGDRRARGSALTGGHQLRAVVGDEHFKITDAQLTQHGLFGLATYFFHVASGVCRRALDANGAGDHACRRAHREVGA